MLRFYIHNYLIACSHLEPYKETDYLVKAYES